MADISKTVSIIFQGQDNASAVSGKIADNMQAIGTEAGGAATKVDQLGKEAEDLGGKSGGVDRLADSLKALATGLVVKAFIDANVEAEKFERAMVLLKGSTEAAGKEFQYIAGVSNTLGISLFESADAFVSLTAATKGTSLEGQATRDIFEAVAKAMAALGKSSADTEGALLAVSQMVSKGTVSMEELRGQLGERLPGAFQTAAKAMGLTTQELDALVSSGKLTATEFLPKFAQALKDTFGDTSFVDGYAASFARLQNSVSLAFIEIGNAGTFDALTKGVQLATAAVTGAVAGFKLLGEVAGAVAAAIATGNFSDLGSAIDAAMNKAADSTRGARDALLGYTDEAASAGTAAKGSANEITSAADDIADGFDISKAQAEALNESLKALGVKPSQVKEPIEAIAKAFSDLAENPAVSGDQILAGLRAALKSADTYDDITRLGGSLTQAFVNGRLSAEDFSKATLLLADDQKKVSDAMERTTGTSKAQSDELKKNEEAARKAQEAAEKMALEYEKIASNERIKNIEFKVELDIARLEEDTKRVQAAFDSINNTINSTGDVISSSLSLLKDFDSLDWGALRIIESQLEKENQLRREAFELQKELTEAQIRSLNAQTAQLEKGDALIKIDGAGLQPHLEAFMFEILKAIQVRVNRDGLPFLLGT
jgi:tape measure domain-containing protein